MIDLDLWFPEDFDKKYEKYLEKNNDSKIPEPFFEERLENVKREKQGTFKVHEEAKA